MAVTHNPSNLLGHENVPNTTPFSEPLLQDLWQAAIREDPTYNLLKTAVIRGDRRFPPDLHIPVDITECTVSNNCDDQNRPMKYFDKGNFP